MPLVSRSADRGRHRSERAPHGRLMDVKNSQNSYPTLSETNQKKEKKMFFFILLSFFAIRNLDHLSCVVQYLFKLFLGGVRHSLDMCWFQSKMSHWTDPLVPRGTCFCCSRWSFTSASVTRADHQIPFFIKNPNTLAQTVLPFVVQMSRLSQVL